MIIVNSSCSGQVSFECIGSEISGLKADLVSQRTLFLQSNSRSFEDPPFKSNDIRCLCFPDHNDMNSQKALKEN